MLHLENTYIYRFLIGFTDIEDYKRILPYAQQQYTPLISVLMVCPPLNRLPLVFFMAVLVLILYGTYTVFLTKTCTLIMDDFVTWSEVIHHTALVYLAIFINAVIHFTKSELLTITRLHMNGIYAYKEGLTDPVYQKLADANKKQQKRMFMVPVLIIVVTGTALLLKPIIDYSMNVLPHPVLLENNITLKSVIPIKYPHKVEDFWEVIAMNIMLFIFALFCVSTIIAADILFISFYVKFSAVASPAIGGGFFTCSIVMGLGMIIMNMDDVNIGDMIAFAGTVIAELLNAFMISWNSELIGELNYELYNAVYGVKWFNWSKKNKTTIITFLDGTREPLFLNAFGLTKINMETFGSVVNTAYSFLNLVKASESLEAGKL